MKLRNPNLIIILSFLLLLFISNVYSPVFSQGDNKTWDIQAIKLTPLNTNPLSTRWFFEHNQFHTASIIDGKIMVFSLTDDAWNEEQCLSLTDGTYTTIQVEDITGDSQPEIIAGTTNPGFIYIYGRDAENNWSVKNPTKYIWSSVANLMIGRFIGTANKEIIAEDNDGSLYFLKNNAQSSLDLVWKSPSVWRNIEAYFISDFDNDLNEEILVSYKSGGIAILKVQNNTVTSVWENYPWGKILAITYGDWNNDGRSELILTTSQKIVYLLAHTEKGYYLKRDPWQFGYLVENLQMLHGETPEMLTTDSSGKLHLLEYQSGLKKWVETQVYKTGRIAKIIFNPIVPQYLLFGMNRSILFLNRANPS